MRRSGMLVAMVLSVVAAQSASATNVWRFNTYVQSIQIAGDGSVLMYVPAPTPVNGCLDAGTRYTFTVGQNGQTAEGVRSSLATALMALSMGKYIDFAFDDVTCMVNTILIKR